MKVSNMKGFTLIELVVVIVILGILAAVAIPAFVNLADDAEAASARGSLGGWRSAVAMSFARAAANGTPAFPTLLNLQAANPVCAGGNCFQTGVGPTNPITGSTAVVAMPAGACTCANRSVATGWFYDAATGNVGAAIGTAAGICNAGHPYSDVCTW